MNETTQTRIMIADDHPLVRGALKESVAGLADGISIVEAGTFDEVTSHLGRGADIDLILGPREAAVARELTKLHEEVRRGTPAELVRWAVGTPPRGEIVVLIGPPAAEAVTDEAIAAKLTPMLSEMSLSAAARVAADELGVAKARAYDIGIALKRLGG